MNREQHFGLVVVVSGPSGVGKSTIFTSLMDGRKKREDMHFSVSCTTRERRPKEINGMDYHFISEATFQENISNGAFLEYAEVHGAHYGTLMSELDISRKGVSVLMDIDVQGMRKVKERLAKDAFYAPRLVTVFIMPPSFAELERRLRGRRTEGELAIQRRLGNAVKEMEAWREYDYTLINDDFQECALALDAIIFASHFRNALITEERWKNV